MATITPSAMEITGLKTYRLVCPLDEPFACALTWTRQRTAGVVEIQTDAGLTGWGEGLSIQGEEELRERLVGRDPRDTEVIWQDLHNHGWGDIPTLSAVDMALWDLMGKAQDVPVCQLLGGAFRDDVPAYASGLFRRDVPDPARALADEARGYAEAGFGAVKMKIGFGCDYDVRGVRAVRAAIGEDIQLAVDANCAYDVGTAMDVGRRLSEYDLLWYEEPIPSDDLDGYRHIRQTLGLPVAGGEWLEGRWAFRELIQGRCVDIVQPDLSVAGGFSECRKIAAMASANRVRVLPHMWGTAIRLAATVQWLAALAPEPDTVHPRPAWLEFDMTENRLRTELAREPIRAEGGRAAVPQGPGLGIEIDREVLERYAIQTSV